VKAQRKPVHHSDRSIGRSQQQRSGVGGDQPAIECRFHTATFHTPKSSDCALHSVGIGRSSNLRKVVAAQQFSLIRRPDAPICMRNAR
jgi:hypothetical protein